jgi:PBP1b-binding outer membrane lipoprotein LpoB
MLLGSKQSRGYIHTMKTSSLLMALALAALGAGCGKHPESEASQQPAATPPATDSSQPAANPPDAPVAVPGNPAGNAVTAAAPAEPDLQQMTRALHHWIMNNQRHPRDFEEFAASSPVHFPPAPAGKQYKIDSSMSVVLVNR